MKVPCSTVAGALLAVLALSLPATAQDDPTIDSINPNGGTLGTVVTIGGTNFGDKKPKVFLTQKGIKKKTALKVTANSATEITAELRKAKTAGDFVLNVQPKGKGITPATGMFTVLAPAIVSVNPDTAMPGDEITVNVTNVGNKKPKVKIGGKKAKVTSFAQGGVGEGVVDTITVIVPKSLANGAWDVEVKNKIDTDMAPAAFTMTGSNKKFGGPKLQASINGSNFVVKGKTLGAGGIAGVTGTVNGSKGNNPNRAIVFNIPLNQPAGTKFSTFPATFQYIETTGNNPQNLEIKTWTGPFSVTYEGLSGGQIKCSFSATVSLKGEDDKVIEGGTVIANFDETQP